MNRTVRSLLIAVAFAPAALSQGTYPVGVKELTFVNRTGRGSPTIPATIYYPAQTAGRDAPLLPRSGGYPVVVFLHGFGALGSFYSTLGDYLAGRGFVAVLGNTAQFSPAAQVLDGLAMQPTLRAAHAEPGNFVQGALDLDHSALAGHSMGGGSTVAVLASDAGYKAGICFAPLNAPASNPLVTVPLLVLHGTGDVVLPWQTSGLAVYQGATGYREIKAFYLLDQACTHLNVAGLGLASSADREVWARCSAATSGFLDRFVQGKPEGLEQVIGPEARAEPHLSALRQEAETPQLWSVGRPGLGKEVHLTLFAQPGPAAFLAAGASTSIETPLGLLRLDPVSLFVLATGVADQDGLLVARITVPSDPQLAGARVPLQAIGLQKAAALRLTELLELTLER